MQTFKMTNLISMKMHYLREMIKYWEDTLPYHKRESKTGSSRKKEPSDAQMRTPRGWERTNVKAA